MSDPKILKPIILPENVTVDLNFERMFKDFIKKVKKSGIIEEVKRRRYYVKPSEIKRLSKKLKRRN